MTVIVRQLRDVCEITMGQAPDGESYNDTGVGLPLIAGAGDFGAHHPQPKKFTSAPTKLCGDGDIVLSIRATIGTKVLSNGKFCLGRGVAGLRPRDSLDGRYLWHWLGSAEGALAARGRGATFPQVSRSDIGELEIPLLPLDEQRRIAAILDKADVLRRKRKRGLELFDDLLTSIFVDTFGDPIENSRKNEIVQVGEVTTCIVPGRDKPKSFTGTIPWITTGELVPLGHTTSECAKLHLSESEIAAVGARIIPAGSVVMTCVGELGLTSIAADRMVINQQLHSFQCSDKVIPEYLMYALAYQREYMLRRATQTTLPYMNKTVCNSIPIQLPPLELQKKFTDRFHQTKRSAKIAILSEQRIAEFFTSLHHRAFPGQL